MYNVVNNFSVEKISCKTCIHRHTIFSKGKPGRLLIEKNSSLKVMFSGKKNLHFESFSGFMIFVPKKKCFLKKKKEKSESSRIL